MESGLNPFKLDPKVILSILVILVIHKIGLKSLSQFYFNTINHFKVMLKSRRVT